MIKTLIQTIGRIKRGDSMIIAAVKKGATIVWQLARACFSGREWRYDRPWLYNEKWSYDKNTH